MLKLKSIEDLAKVSDEELARALLEDDVVDILDLEKEREHYNQLHAEYNKIESIALEIKRRVNAICDAQGSKEVLEKLGTNVGYLQDCTQEFMYDVASEIEQQYDGGYGSSEGYFWIPSNC